MDTVILPLIGFLGHDDLAGRLSTAGPGRVVAYASGGHAQEVTGEQALADAAKRQYGLFTMEQAVAAGLGGSVVRRRVASGVLIERQPHVLQAATSPWDATTAAAAALLSAGSLAMLSHQSAAAVWGLGPSAPQTPWITLPFRSRLPTLHGVEVVRSRYTAGIRRTRAGLAVTAPARTYVDLGRVVDREALESSLANGMQRGLITLSEVEAALEVAHHRAGTQLARGVLRHFQPEWESILSAQLGRLFAQAGLSLQPGFVLRDADGSVLAVLDFADAGAKLAVEADGWAFHGSKEQQQTDRARDRRLLALGWRTLRFTTEDIGRRSAALVQEVLAVLRGITSGAAA